MRNLSCKKEESASSSPAGKFFFVLISIFVVVLPISEAIKNISFIFIFPMIFIFTQNKIPVTNYLNISLLFFCLSAVFSGAGFVEYFETHVWRNVINWLTIPLVLYVIAVSNLTIKQIEKIYFFICFGGVLAVIESFINWNSVYPELRSVGQVNHSALYLNFVVISAFMIFHHPLVYYRITAYLCLMLFLVFLGFSGSIVSFIGFLLTISLFIVYLFWSSKILIFKSLFWLGLILFLSLIISENFSAGPWNLLFNDLIYRMSSLENLWSGRDRLYYTSYYFHWLHPLFGVGIGNYAATVNELFVGSVQSLFGGLDAESLIYRPHAHSLVMNSLVERGSFGLLSFTIGMMFLAVALLRAFRLVKEKKFVFAAILSVGLVIVLGLVQTTMHSEHGLLFALIVGLAFRHFGTECSALSRK